MYIFGFGFFFLHKCTTSTFCFRNVLVLLFLDPLNLFAKSEKLKSLSEASRALHIGERRGNVYQTGSTLKLALQNTVFLSIKIDAPSLCFALFFFDPTTFVLLDFVLYHSHSISVCRLYQQLSGWFCYCSPLIAPVCFPRCQK